MLLFLEMKLENIFCVLDLDECESRNNGGCNQQCTNTVGSFLCSCNSTGFLLDADQRTCHGCINFVFMEY